MAYIRIHLQAGPYPSEWDVDVGLPLAENIVMDTFRPLDFPSEDAGIAALFCTDSVTIQKTLIKRERIAKLISEAVTEQILKAMQKKDTEMGYPKESASTVGDEHG